jgi:hypothetical protein
MNESRFVRRPQFHLTSCRQRARMICRVVMPYNRRDLWNCCFRFRDVNFATGRSTEQPMAGRGSRRVLSRPEDGLSTINDRR